MMMSEAKYTFHFKDEAASSESVGKYKSASGRVSAHTLDTLRTL